MKNQTTGGRILFLSGVLLILLALGLIAYNLTLEKKAARASEAALEQVQLAVEVHREETAEAESPEEAVPSYVLTPGMAMPVKTVDGRDYIGTLSVPALELELPVMSEWDYDRLMIAPCRFYGTVYLHNMVVAAHNFDSHFGRLKELSIGDSVTFTDTDGNLFRYEIIGFEELGPDAREEMISGEWDLTLFTCTIGGQTRFTVRCRLTE